MGVSWACEIPGSTLPPKESKSSVPMRTSEVYCISKNGKTQEKHRTPDHAALVAFEV